MKIQYLAMIKDTILKEARSKTLLIIFLATTATIIFSHIVLSTIYNQTLSEGGGAAFSLAGSDILSYNFLVLNVLSFLIAVVFGVSVFRSDFQNNIIYQYLTLPISRTEYFFARVFGTWFLVLGYYLYAYLLSSVLFSIAFKSNVLKLNHLLGFLILAVYLVVVIFLASLFSLILNKIGALFTTSFVALISFSAFKTFSQLPYNEFLQNLGFFKILGLFTYYLFPRISYLNELAGSLISNQKFEVNHLEQIIHLIIIVSGYVFLTNFIIKKKDF